MAGEAMTLDPELVKRALAEGAQLAEAERQALLARAEYHSAIRRAHLAGGSLREIAQTLGLSHQRVQQIVEGAGGTWWQRVWRSRGARRDAVCTFCDRPPSEVSKLIAGPNVFICDACVAIAEAMLAQGASAAPTGGWNLSQARARVRCSFCGRRASAERPVCATESATVCGECVPLCRQILDERAA
jgi:hypothetical protein